MKLTFYQACEDISPDFFIPANLVDFQVPRRNLVRFFERSLFIAAASMIAIPILLSIILISVQIKEYPNCYGSTPLAIWAASALTFSILHTHLGMRPDLKKQRYLSIFGQKYHMYHMAIGLIVTAMVQVSIQNCSPELAQWLWILYVFPPMLASEYNTTNGYVYSIISTIALLFITEAYQMNTVRDLRSLYLLNTAGFIVICIKALFIFSLTAARHYAIRLHIIWVERNHLLQSVLQAVSKTKFQSHIEQNSRTEWNWIAQEIAQRLKFDKVFILLLDEKGKEFILVGGAGVEEEYINNIHFSKNQGVSGHVLKTKLPHLAKKTGTQVKNGCPHYITFSGFDMTRSELALPITVNNRVLGILDIQSDRFDDFSKEDIDVASTLSTSLALRLEHKYELMSRQEDTSLLATLKQKASAVHQQNSIKKIFDDLSQNLTALFQADLVTLYLLAPGTSYPISPPYSFGTFKDETRLKLPLTNNSVIFDLIIEWEPKFFEDALSEPFLTDIYGEVKNKEDKILKRFVLRENVISTAFLPIGTINERVAALFINYRRPFHFDDPYKLRLQALLSIYAVQIVTTQQRELRNSPLFIDVPDLHSMFDIKLIDLISSFQEKIGDQKANVNDILGTLRGQLKEVIKEILKSKISENELSKDKYGLARLAENYAIVLKHASNRELNVKVNIDPLTYYTGKAVNQAIYAVISEAMLNAVQYGDANTIEVDVKKDLSSIDIRVRDNGSGFNVEEATKLYNKEGSEAWTGISGIFGRLKAMKVIFGSITKIESNSKGTLILVKIPLLAEVGNE